MELAASDATGQFRELFALAPTWMARARKVDGSAQSGRRRWVARRQLDQGRASPTGAIADRVDGRPGRRGRRAHAGPLEAVAQPGLALEGLLEVEGGRLELHPDASQRSTGKGRLQRHDLVVRHRFRRYARQPSTGIGGGPAWNGGQHPVPLSERQTGVAMQELATHVHTAVLVEGDSDRLAVDALARRHGRQLDTEGVAVVAIGGATNAGHAVRRYGPAGRDLRLVALCDVAEVGHFARAHEPWRAAVAAGEPAVGGLFVCDADLEDELIRAIGTAAMVAFVEAQGEGQAFDTFRRQPYQRDRPLDAQLRRFIGTKSGRKIRYGAALVEAVPLDAMPAPLAGLVAAL